MNDHHILFIDDDPLVLNGFRRALADRHPEWNARFMECPQQAWSAIQDGQYETVVTDMNMPLMSGLDLLHRVKSDDRTSSIPVIIVTGSTEKDAKRAALDLGASDLLSKPIAVEDLVARIRNSLKIKHYEDRLRRHGEILEQEVRRITAELSASHMEIIWRLAKASELRDEATGNHVVRVGAFSKLVAHELAMPSDFVESLFHAAPLHDIGKLGIPDSILLKAGLLTPEERATMQQHCHIGAAILMDESKLARVAIGHGAAIEPLMHSTRSNPFLQMAAHIARSHHERWDGQGYPDRLAGETIPLAARIVAICDVYDALRSRRPYKEPMSIDDVLAFLNRESGKHFDPVIVEAFLCVLPQVQNIEAELP